MTGMATIVVQLGLATMPLGIEEVGSVHLGHDQRDVVVHAPGTGVVDHDRTGRPRPRGEFFDVEPPAEKSAASRPL